MEVMPHGKKKYVGALFDMVDQADCVKLRS